MALWGPATVVFIGATIAASGAFWTSLRQAEMQRQRAEFEKQLRTKSEEIAALSRDIAGKSDEIARLNRDIAATVTGGDSFCYLAVAGEGGSAPLMLVHSGQHPLYDISIRMVNVQKFEQLKGRTLEDITQADTVLNLGNLPPTTAMQVGKHRFPDADIQDFNIFITARNGFLTQLLRCRRLGDRWVSATKVVRGHDTSVPPLFENVDKDFPRDKDGKIKW